MQWIQKMDTKSSVCVPVLKNNRAIRELAGWQAERRADIQKLHETLRNWLKTHKNVNLKTEKSQSGEQQKLSNQWKWTVRVCVLTSSIHSSRRLLLGWNRKGAWKEEEIKCSGFECCIFPFLSMFKDTQNWSQAYQDLEKHYLLHNYRLGSSKT